jgi:hypothetical protein
MYVVEQAELPLTASNPHTNPCACLEKATLYTYCRRLAVRKRPRKPRKIQQIAIRV